MRFYPFINTLREWTSDFGWLGGIALYITTVLLVSSVAHFLIARLEKELQSRHLWINSLNLVKRFFFPVETFLICAPLVAILPRLDMPDEARAAALGITKIGTVVAIAILAARAVSVIADLYLRRFHADREGTLRQRALETQVRFLVTASKLFIAFIAIAAVLLSFERFRSFGSSLLASAGLASVIVGLASQRSLANLIAGFQIAFTQPIRLGDSVQVENEIGTIEEITLTYVVVRVWDLRRLVLPINYFLERPFQNWTRTSSQLIGNVNLSVDYSLPIEKVRKELERILDKNPLWDGEVQNIQVVEADSKSRSIRILVSAANADALAELKSEVRERLAVYIYKVLPAEMSRDQVATPETNPRSRSPLSDQSLPS